MYSKKFECIKCNMPYFINEVQVKIKNSDWRFILSGQKVEMIFW